MNLRIGAGRGRGRSALFVALLSLAPSLAFAQAWRRFDVADSSLAPAVKASGGEFEAAWNSLLVASLRAGRGGSRDSAAHLAALSRRVAAAETQALGSRIGADALARVARWKAPERAIRIRAAETESLAVAAQGARRFPQAESLYRAALAGYRRIREARREAWVLGSLGQTLFLSGDIPRADSVYRAALVARRAIADDRMIGNTLNVLGGTSYLLRRYTQAWDWYGQARVVRERTGERGALGSTLNGLGNTAVQLGRADTALICYRAAIELTVAAGDSARTGEALANLASTLVDLGERVAAAPYLERALRIARARGDARVESSLQRSLGVSRSSEGRFAEAAEHFQASVERGRDVNDPRLVVEAETELSRLGVLMQSPSFGRPHGERAAALAESLGSGSDQALALINLSALASFDGDRSGAERLALQALAIGGAAGDSAVVHGAAEQLGELGGLRGDRDAEWRWHSRAEGAGRSLGLEIGLGDRLNLAVAHIRRGELDSATTLLEQNLETASEADYPQGEWQAMLGLGDVAEKRGAFSEALAWDRRAATRVDTLRGRAGSETGAVSVLARRRFVFEALVHLLGKLDAAHPDSGWAAEGFWWSERAKARAFLDLMGAEGRTTAIAPLTLADARSRLGSGEALLAYSVGDSSTSLWVITPRAWRQVLLPPRGVLRARAEVLRRSLADPATAESPRARAAARALDSLLIEPARPLLEGVTHLVIAPDDALALIPFEVLLSRPAAGGRVPAGAYLVERFAISYVPSATALATLRAPAADARGIVALGNPAFAGEGAGSPALAPLPYTAEEVAGLAALARGRPFASLTGAEATRARLLALPSLATAELIHVATHGEANETEPRRSGLWLAADGEGVPFLSVGDILDLRLAAELVTLSACETGLGRLERGEGVMGLTRAFLAAGARSVVVSLWKVNDRSTAELMRRFYGTLLTRGVAREAALAAAKRALLADPATRSPFHWAPFVLIGESGRLDAAGRGGGRSTPGRQGAAP